ncbi:porin [Bradyrhizobium sp. LHD-71]|uniref:porin n=1 Tax=Bradyrhizobium sp. LHD-71 TaxID=3072141 RepID=UPI00281039ED|nr:porin [Bradyrhizobium sp. LHD-71]MDQ8730960.1 porin [Bradyrhizobium sp. LHD-71]
MTMIRSLLLGSAAGVVALTGAQAADLPVKAKPVEYVKICSLYGAGFYYIPGTDTCIRIGGHIRAELNFNARGTLLQQWTTDGTGNNTRTRDRDHFFARSRVFTNVDTRTQTAFGTLRTFSVVRAEVNTPNGLLTSGPGSSAGVIAIDSGIIQWGGFTIGRAGTSYFDNPWAYAYKWGTNGWLGNPDTAGGRFVAAYTYQFGNGVSGTLSVEDGKERKRGNYNGANPLTILGLTSGLDTRGGNTWPEIVGQLRIDQAWGGFHLSGMVVNNHVAYNCGGVSGTTTVLLGGCSELAGAPSDKVGYGVNAAFKFNVPTGINDALYIGGTYSKGATTDVFANIGQGSAFGIYGGSNGLLTYGSIAGTYLFDSVYTSGPRTGAGIAVGPTGQELTTAYGGSIAFEHGWTPEWRTSVFGGAQVLDYSDTANAILCSRFGIGSTTGTLTVGGVNISNTGACNFDYRIYGAGTRTYWTPVRDLTIGVEFMWTNHHVSHGDNVVYNQPVISGFKPNAAYEIRDQNVFSGIFSVRRFF